MSAKQLAALKLRSRQSPASSKFEERCPSPQGEVLDQPATIPILPVFCICNRQLQDILCRTCGHCFVGRVRKQCPVHPSAILLMDSPCCPHCKGSQLMEIRTSNTPDKKGHDDNEIEEELKVLRRRRHSSTSGRSLGSPESWETEHTSWDSEPKTPPGTPTMSAGYHRILAIPSDKFVQQRFAESVGKLGMREWDVERSSENSPNVKSVGNLGQRFSRIVRDGSSSDAGRNDPWRRGVLTEAVKRQQNVTGWEDEIENMSEMCIGDRRWNSDRRY